jgi:hypothetical protein
MVEADLGDQGIAIARSGPDGIRFASLDDDAMPAVQRSRDAASDPRPDRVSVDASTAASAVAVAAERSPDDMRRSRRLAWADLLRRVLELPWRAPPIAAPRTEAAARGVEADEFEASA